MHKRIWWMLNVAALAALGALAAMAMVTPPNLSKALEAQQMLVAQKPGDSDALNDLGNLLVMARRYPDAEQAYRQAVELAPDNADHRFNLGLLLQQMGKLDEAVKEFRQVLELQPEHAWAHFQIGSVYEQQGLRQRAVAAYAEAFYRNPNLALSEVNPQVIESGLVTESMLLAYRRLSDQPLTSPAYDDPSRIVGLLIDHSLLQMTAEASEQEGETEASGGDKPGADAVRRAEEEEKARAGEEGKTRVLNKSSLEGSRGATAGAVRGKTVVAPPPSTSAPRSTTRPLPQLQSRKPGSPRYTPGSTGSLDLQLIPGRPQPQGAGVISAG